MITQFKLAHKDRTFSKVNAKLTTTNKTFIDGSDLIGIPSVIYLKITHQQINTTINLPLSSPYVLLYFTMDEKFEDHLKFDGANYSLGTTGSFTVITKSKHILLIPLPLKFKLEQVEKLMLTKMNFKITTKYGRQFEIDLTKWKIDDDSRHCKIIEIAEGHLLLENKHEDRFSIPEHLIKANELNVIDNIVELTKGLYEHWFLKKFRAESKRLLNVSYENYASVIFQNRNVVLNRAEYYLLNPSSLSSGFMYTGGINFTLGKLFESFESGNHIYYAEFCGYKKMYLVSMAASPLSGTIYKAIFWSDESNEFVRFDSKSNLPKNFGIAAGRALIEMLRGNEMVIDRQDKALNNLINEINAGKEKLPIM